MRWFFLVLPWLELFTLIQLGSEIGALSALAYVFLTLFLGITIIRLQGMELVSRLRSQQANGVVVGQLLSDDLSLGLAGLLLLIPGLVTDCLAVLVLIGPLRRRVVDWFRGGRSRSQNGRWDADHTASSRPQGPNQPLEGEFRRLDDD